MRFWTGKVLQLLGLGALPVAIYHGETAGSGALGEEILILAAGGLVFLAGRYVDPA